MQEKLSSFNYKRDLYDWSQGTIFSREKKEDILKKCLQGKILSLYNEKGEMINVKALPEKTLLNCLKLALNAICEDYHAVYYIIPKKVIPNLRKRTEEVNQAICYGNYRNHFFT